MYKFILPKLLLKKEDDLRNTKLNLKPCIYDELNYI